MTKQELKQLSNQTFIDNDEGLIKASEHRAFNNEMLDSVVVQGVPVDLNVVSETSVSVIQLLVTDFGAFYILYISATPVGEPTIFSIKVDNFNFGNNSLSVVTDIADVTNNTVIPLFISCTGDTISGVVSEGVKMAEYPIDGRLIFAK